MQCREPSECQLLIAVTSVQCKITTALFVAPTSTLCRTSTVFHETVHKEWLFSFSSSMAIPLSLVTAGINMCREGVELKPPNKKSLAYKMILEAYKEKACGWSISKVFSVTKQSQEWYYEHFFPGLRWAQWEPSELFCFPSIFPSVLCTTQPQEDSNEYRNDHKELKLSK